MILKIGAKGTKIHRGAAEKKAASGPKNHTTGGADCSTGFTSLSGLNR
jgi:hypothetical protein